MTASVERVSYKQVYDLVFRARNARLDSVAYTLDFFDWIRAGVAFNTRGYELNTRKISYFAELYNIVSAAKQGDLTVLEGHKAALAEALVFFYADIFSIYQDHLRSRHRESSLRKTKAPPVFGELLVLPCFEEVPFMRSLFETRTYPYNNYVCVEENKFLECANSAYIKPGTGLFSCMSLMFDYGEGRKGYGVLLEVELWE